MAEKVEASKRQRKLLRRWARGSRYKIGAKQVQDWLDCGWIEYVSGPMPGGGYCSMQVLSDLGNEVAFGD